MDRIRRISKSELIILLVVGVAAVGAVAAVIGRETSPDWKYYQREFAAIVEETLGSAEPSQVPRGIQQIWVEDLDRVDRCVTCHQGMFWAGLERVEQPWGTHPRAELFESHPVEKYGCTICHGGQGFAVDVYEAHGYSRHWEEPLLAKPIASEYDPVNPPPLLETHCNYCHRYERSTPGMDYLNRAKSLVRQKGCKICHVVNGQGGRLGPDLTHVGDKHAEEFDFSNLATEQLTVFNWHLKHFKSPTTVVPASIMPDLNLQTKDALFVCHSIEAFEIQSPTNKGPDLSWAPDDVRTRFNKTVEEFLFEPTGTMKIILESQLVLTDEQKWEAINKIMRAYDIVKNREQEQGSR
jgi:hypothetical protein